ncbi:MAG: TPM domain-containing protein, partial [Victivallales bacterium]|nr:TPM domain-containing protein [Victivallales bacterium]
MRLSSQDAQEPLQSQGEAQAKPTPKTCNAMYVDDLAKLLLKDDYDELKKIALGSRREVGARIHFITGILKPGSKHDEISARLAKVSGVGVDDGDDDREAIFAVTCEKTENGLIPHVHLISGKGLEDVIEKSRMRQFLDKELMTALSSKEATDVTRSKSILNAYARIVKFIADDAEKKIDGLDALLDAIAPLVSPPSPAPAEKIQTQDAAPQAAKVVPHDYPDPGIPPKFQGLFPPKPDHKMYVCDWGEMLTTEDRAYMEHLGEKLDALTTAELVIVTVETLKQESLNDVALKTANTWGIGKKGKDNGCLLFVVRDKMLSKSKGKITIQVGYGLEGRLNDAKCG